jgi:pimeloyl-[acyl-carrier protein] methyl ester esterase
LWASHRLLRHLDTSPRWYSRYSGERQICRCYYVRNMEQATNSCEGSEHDLRLVLLPGMDGTGQLFADFRAALPPWVVPEVIRYPTDRTLSYAQLQAELRPVLSRSGPFVLLAESFSSPLAVRVAADAPSGLRGLVICAGFVRPPVGGIVRAIVLLTASALCRFMRLVPLTTTMLLPANASPDLVKRFQTAIRSVQPAVMADRLRAVLTCDATTELRKVRVPILYIAASNDRVVRGRSLQLLTGLRPDARIARVRGSHLILQSNPGDAASAVAEFIRSVAMDHAAMIDE